MGDLVLEAGAGLLKLKSELLCHGIRVSTNSVDTYFLEHDFVHESQILLGRDIVVNVPVNEAFVLRYSPFELKRELSGWSIVKNGLRLAQCRPLLMPGWVRTRLSGTITAGDIVKPHSDTVLFCASVRRCVFDASGQKCGFCTIWDDATSARSDLSLARRAFETAFAMSNQYTDVAIGGATPNLADCGARYYARLVELVKKLSPDIRISLEMIPPPDLGLLRTLRSAGVDSVIMNLEVFDDVRRRQVCPGKGMIPKSHYYAAWAAANEVFGRNRVSSVLIVGLEPRVSTVNGCRTMMGMGVAPTLIPFRPYDSCRLGSRPPTSPDYYFSVCREALSARNGSAGFAVRQPGCTGCGGCSLETALTMACA